MFARSRRNGIDPNPGAPDPALTPAPAADAAPSVEPGPPPAFVDGMARRFFGMSFAELQSGFRELPALCEQAKVMLEGFRDELAAIKRDQELILGLVTEIRDRQLAPPPDRGSEFDLPPYRGSELRKQGRK